MDYGDKPAAAKRSLLTPPRWSLFAPPLTRKINIDDLITHTMPLEDINKAFDLMHSGESIRGVVVF